MGAPRQWAARLLGFVVRHAPARSRDWASAMLRELDFIEGDWAALYWALGSMAALIRHAASGWRSWFRGRIPNKEEPMNNFGKKALGVGSGIGLAFLLVLCAFGVQSLLEFIFPSLRQDHAMMTHAITMILIPEVTFVVAAIILWRKRTAVAAGILLFAIAAGAHVAFFLATHSHS
jgi:hypothetical protein